MYLKIKNANIHNLKNFSVEIPHNKFVCITGVSGSGKSSLVADIIEKEANKRFFESFSVYARTYLAKTGEVDADISGIRPVVSIKQKTITGDLRSTAGTLSGITDLLRLLFARCGNTPENIKLSRGMFSFNNPVGQCSHCLGLGEEEYVDEKLLIEDEIKTLRDRALKITLKDGYTIYSQVTIDVLDQVCQSEGFNVDIPFDELTEYQRNVIFHGSDKIKIAFGKHTLESRMKWVGITAKPRDEGYYKGIIPIMSEILKRDRNKNILKFVSSKTCSHCNGSGLKKESLNVTFTDKNFPFYTSRTFSELNDIFTAINSTDEVQKEIISAILKKCEVLINLGLGYLTPERKSSTLSGGESQRLRIAAVLDSKMSGIMYIFDEPSIGLHGTDNFKLITVFKELVSRGNSVIVVEHDKDTILASDHLIDIGPGAGYLGGKLLFNGNTSDFIRRDNLLWLSESESITQKELNNEIVFKQPVQNDSEYLSIKNAHLNNLKDINVDFKLNRLNVVTGVSGAGKSSLVNGVVAKNFKNVVEIDAKQPGKNSRSNAMTYTGIFDAIRKLFSKLPDSLPATAFSFNTGTGRCEECLGKGETEITMHFLDNIKLTCSSCNGKRFHDDVLKIKYKEKSIYDVLELEISEACEFFRDEKKIFSKLDILNRLGLGYLKLGQPTSTLSGGEAKRLKLSAFLDTKAKDNLILLDEPTTGLSMYDTKVLLKNLEDISKVGNTIIAIEHDAYFISQSDYIVDLGPGAGDQGGEVLYQGSLKGLLNCKRSLTAKIFDLNNKIVHKENIISDKIILKDVSTNNLKSIDLKIEKNKITLVKGGEGSGKTSLITDTLFNEANNLYLSSLSAYARQFIGTSSKGEFGSIRNLSPAISLSLEKRRNDRISFAQVSGLYELYRLLYSRFSSTDIELPVHQKNNSLFSFLHINGACQNCSGRGIVDEVDVNKLADFKLSLEDGAMNGSKPGKFFSELTGQYMATLYTVMELRNIVLGKNLEDYSKDELNLIFNGTGDIEYDVNWSYERATRKGVHKFRTKWIGFANLVREDYLINLHNIKKKNFDSLLSEKKCSVCNGKRLNNTALSYKINDFSISELTNKSIKNSIEFFKSLKLDNSEVLTDKILKKLQRLEKFNLDYITLSRSYNTLSSGEKQRLRLAMLAEEKLTDILYILDEPANGLYYKEEHLISEALKELKDLGNTIVISDPKERFVSVADNIVELKDGMIKFNNAALSYHNDHSITKQVFPNGNRTFSVKNAYLHNLKHIDVDFEYNTLNVVHGPCGSGKSTLVFKVLAESLKNRITGCRSVDANFENIIVADDHYSSITVGSFFGMNNIVIDKLAKANKVKKAIFTASSSYCPACQGKGIIKGNLDFLRETDKICSVCEGKKYKPEILEYKLSDKNIYELLNLSIDSLSKIVEKKQLSNLNKYFKDLGINNLSLNRKFTTLSTWQRKRLVLIKELLNNPKNNLIVIDEPSAGLDLHDIEILLKSFKILIENNTLIITEHDYHLINCAGKSIELGHGSGEKGGYLVNKL
ncbi:MAG: ATP-binding cassette domain-containing protein [Candidatus Delongbacteria bacterium]|jgi:excinuclease ABC subunit A|nr:ATP-binding cassette domain-containing protein [Candidatus Delongbacteria bacterium]